MTYEQAMHRALELNVAIPVGTKVRYYPGALVGEGVEGEIRGLFIVESRAGGNYIVVGWVTGLSGYIDANHIEINLDSPEPPLPIMTDDRADAEKLADGDVGNIDPLSETEAMSIEVSNLIKAAVMEEREACAKLAETLEVMHGDQYGGFVGPSDDGPEIAAAIRRRSR